MPNPVVHWEIATKDAKGLSEFYTNVLIPVIQSTPTLPLGLPA